MLCVLILYMSGGTEQQTFEKLFHGNFIYTQTFCQKPADELYFHILFGRICLKWGLKI